MIVTATIYNSLFSRSRFAFSTVVTKRGLVEREEGQMRKEHKHTETHISWFGVLHPIN